MVAWSVEGEVDNLHLVEIARRSFGASELTWADLLHFRLSQVHVYALYFPSRFELSVDSAVKDALRTFGEQTGPDTSINFWDPTDPEFSRALTFFQLQKPPALLMV